MNTNFILNPYNNLYKNNRLVNKIRNVLLLTNHPKITKSLNDYKLIENCLEDRFNISLDEAFLKHFNVVLDVLNITLEFDDADFSAEDIFYNNRYGSYINESLNQVLSPFNIKLTLNPKNSLLYEIFIETCNIYSKGSLWESVKKHKNISTPYDYFIGRLSAESKQHMNEQYYSEIIFNIKNSYLNESNKIPA